MSIEHSPEQVDPRVDELNKMTVAELKGLADEMQLKTVSGVRKSELIELIITKELKIDSNRKDKVADSLVVEEAGPYWLALRWQVSEKLLRRAVSSLGKDWHSAKKVIRLYRVDWDDSGPHAREHIKDFLIPNDARNWFVNIDQKNSGWKLELGFLAPNGKFFSLLHSADIQIDSSKKHDSSYPSSKQQNIDLNLMHSSKAELSLNITGEVSLKGATTPGAKVSSDDQQITVNDKTGLFHWKTPMENGRMVIPLQSEIGNQRQRVIISVESNFHYLEPEKTGIDT